MSKSNVKKISKRVFWGSLIFAFFPLLILILSYILSNLLDCSTAYAGSDSCRIGGQLLGGIVYSMFTFGFYLFYSIPIGFVLAIASGIGYLTTRKNKI